MHVVISLLITESSQNSTLYRIIKCNPYLIKHYFQSFIKYNVQNFKNLVKNLKEWIAPLEQKKIKRL